MKTARRRLNRSVVALLLMCPVLATAADQDKVVRLRPAGGEITIDGVVDACWLGADSVADFCQFSPYYRQSPSRRTVARVLSTPEALYCLLTCYDERDHVETQTGLFDQPNGDIVSIMLDTFDDRRSAYRFAVSAAGVRTDARFLDDGRVRDYSWDGIWFGTSKVYGWGFVVEMMIPYKSLRYANDLREWGVDFDRWIQWKKEDVYWCDYEQNEGLRISKFGRLVFDGTRPGSTGLNLEVYPVGVTKATYLGDERYKIDPDAGIDLFYNPSETLTFQLTANPDFAQIEADPFKFNISRYETYFDERRPFFIEGNEVFLASGQDYNSGFYSPLELFYSRRIGKLLPGGVRAPLVLGTKAFGRINEWEYGTFFALTGKEGYEEDGESLTEPRATFASARIKRQILDNSSVGLLFVGKKAGGELNGVLDIDGAFRTSDFQLSYQIARSIQNGAGDFAGAIGYRKSAPNWLTAARLKAIGNEFDIQQVGYVPWKGMIEFTALTGPVWFYDDGPVKQLLIYAGPSVAYEHLDLYTDHAGLVGINMSFRSGWGYEVTFVLSRNLDDGRRYTGYELDVNAWFDTSPRWAGSLSGGYAYTFNFSREYVASYIWGEGQVDWKALNTLTVGTSYDMYLEGNPSGAIEEITYNARPFVSFTPFNNLNFRLYVDNVFVRSSNQMERLITGLLFSYNFLPKSWMYFAVNDIRDRSEEQDNAGNILPRRMHVTDRVGVLKLKYLYYF
jgi:hypothetical protein